MILNKTTEYSLAVLGYMAVSQDDIFSAEFLHHELKIPRRYLRKLLTDLSKLGFILSTKGRNGGFAFARPLGEINLAAIIKTVEGSELMESCILGHQSCKEEQPCVMHETWLEAKTKMLEALSNTTLHDLRERKKAKSD